MPEIGRWPRVCRGQPVGGFIMKRISSLTLTLLVCLAPAGAIAQVMTPALDAAAASRLAAFAVAEARTRNAGGSIAVVDSGHFKGREEIDHLEQTTEENVAKYVDLARRLGFAAEGVTEVGIEVVQEATEVCEQIARQYPKATIISGKLVFRHEGMFNRLLHNETPMLIQRRLQWLGVPMVVLPVRATV